MYHTIKKKPFDQNFSWYGKFTRSLFSSNYTPTSKKKKKKSHLLYTGGLLHNFLS